MGLPRIVAVTCTVGVLAGLSACNNDDGPAASTVKTSASASAPQASPTGFFAADSGKHDSLATASCGDAVQEESQGSEHLKLYETHTYRSYPPTSGDHDPDPLGRGWYSTPLVDAPSGSRSISWARAVHSLEHAYVVILHRGLSSADEARLRAAVDGHDKVIAAPDKAGGPALTLLAWTVKQTCTAFDASAVDTFIKTYMASPFAPEPNGP